MITVRLGQQRKQVKSISTKSHSHKNIFFLSIPALDNRFCVFASAMLGSSNNFMRMNELTNKLLLDFGRELQTGKSISIKSHFYNQHFRMVLA